MIVFPGLLMANMPNPEAGGAGSNISFVNAAGYAAAGGAMPTGNIDDDLYVVSSMRTDGTPTPPTLPAGEGYAVITEDSDISPTGGSGTVSGGRFSWKYSDEPTETSGSWTGGQTTCMGLYRGVHASVPILSAKWNAGSGGDVVFPALTHNNPTAWVVLMCRVQNAVTLNSTSYAVRHAATRRTVLDSNGTAGTFSGLTVGTSAAPGRWITLALALQSS